MEETPAVLRNPNSMARTLGLDIILLNPDGSDAAQWEDAPCSWKVGLCGRITNTCEELEDPAWALTPRRM
jgi:hypothetical protein